MKRLVTILMIIGMFPGVAQLFDEAPAKPDRFAQVDLQKLRKVIINQLLKDKLIQNRKAEVFLFLKEDGIALNRSRLPVALDKRYTALLDNYDLGRGPNRVILINSDCTAVGDFSEDTFWGKSRGRLNLRETQLAFQALE